MCVVSALGVMKTMLELIDNGYSADVVGGFMKTV